MKKEEVTHPFINYLYSLVENDDRGTLADLRRGLTSQPGTVPAMFPHVAKWVPDEARNSWNEKVYYLTATLFAYYQAGGSGKRLTTHEGNFGSHCRELKAKSTQSGSFEARFANLLKANRDDLPVLLRQILSLLKNEDIPINWNQLFTDLKYWNSPNQSVQRHWANNYWRYEGQSSTQENSPIQA